LILAICHSFARVGYEASVGFSVGFFFSVALFSLRVWVHSAISLLKSSISQHNDKHNRYSESFCKNIAQASISTVTNIFPIHLTPYQVIRRSLLDIDILSPLECDTFLTLVLITCNFHLLYFCIFDLLWTRPNVPEISLKYSMKEIWIFHLSIFIRSPWHTTTFPCLCFEKLKDCGSIFNWIAQKFCINSNFAWRWLLAIYTLYKYRPRLYIDYFVTKISVGWSYIVYSLASPSFIS
jgi:hypothetical protein